MYWDSATLETIDPSMPFAELGFTSIMTAELLGRLNGMTDLRIPASVILDCPTSDAVAAHIGFQLADPSRGAQGGPGARGLAGGGGLEDARDVGVVELSVARDGSSSTLVSMFRGAREVGLIDPVRADADDGFAIPAHVHHYLRMRGRRGLGQARRRTSLRQPDLPTHDACHVRYPPIREVRQGVPGRPPISALALPGFAGAEPVPAPVEAIVEALGVGVEARNGDARLVLVGRSSGR